MSADKAAVEDPARLEAPVSFRHMAMAALFKRASQRMSCMLIIATPLVPRIGELQLALKTWFVERLLFPAGIIVTRPLSSEMAAFITE